MAEFFKREVFALLLGEELISEALVEKISGWRHSGFSVHSKVQAKTRKEVERVGKYMIRPLLSLERLSFNKKEGKVSYRYGKEAEEVERMDSLEFIARTTSHIPDKGQVTVRYFGLYANAHRGKVRKSKEGEHKFIIVEEECPRIPRQAVIGSNKPEFFKLTGFRYFWAHFGHSVISRMSLTLFYRQREKREKLCFDTPSLL